MADNVSGPEKLWRDALNQGRFLIQRDGTTGEHQFPPRVGSAALDWVEASGLGTVYSVTRIARKPPEEAYNVVLIDLDEGPRLMSRVEGLPADQVTIGLKVKARIAAEEDGPVLVFDPA